MESCRLCSAHLFDGAEFCPRCFTPVIPSDEEIAAGLVEVHAAGGRWRDPRPIPVPWAPDLVHTEPRGKPVLSRWRRGVFSFSTPVKLAISFLVVIGIPWIMWMMSGGLGIGSVMIWYIVVPPRVLRDLWKRTRVS
jgi:hypothetical protein